MDASSKPLGLFSLLALGVNGIVGVGIFYAPAQVMELVPGGAGALVYPVAGLGLLPIAVVYGRLGKQFSQNGGPYVWSRAAFGPLVGFCFGWLAYVAALISAAAVLSGLGTQLGGLLGWPSRLAALACLTVFALVASLGLRLSALSFSAITVLKLLPLVALLWLGLRTLPLSPPQGALHSSLSLGRATLLVVFALQGFEVVPVLAGSASKPSHVRRATTFSLVFCAALYALLHAICAHTLLGQAAAAPLIDAAGLLAGAGGRELLIVGQLLSALGIAFGQIVTTPHLLSVLGNAQGFGSWLSVTRESGVPLRALLLTCLAIGLFLVQQELTNLLVLSSVAVLAQYGVAACSLLVLARRGAMEQAGRSSVFWALLAIAASATLVSAATLSELLITVLVESAGIALFLAVAALRARRAAPPGTA